MKISDWMGIDSLLSKHKIDCLYHFTDRSNLNSIIANRGLMSWADCKEKNISISRPGGDFLSRQCDERDNLHHYVRLSFTNQHPMMFVACKEGRIPNPIILEVDKSVLFEDTTLFSNMNAVKKEALVGRGWEYFKEIHFSSLFSRSYFDLPSEEKKYFQAEVLVRNYIPLEKIHNIGEFNLPLPEDVVLKNTLGHDKYIYDREAIEMLSLCFWELSHTDYIRAVCLFTMVFEMYDSNNTLQIFIRGILDSTGLFHLVVSKRRAFGICSITLEHFVNLLVSYNMFDDGMKRKLSILINQ